jgi:transposase
LTSRHPLTLKDLPLRGFETILKLWRRKGWCDRCGKTRSEYISFLSEESPHFTKDYTWWLGTMCEFAPVSRVAELVSEQNMTVRRIDLKRMQTMLKKYKIPEVTHIAVDEVYARKKAKYKDENRNEKFFTVISDLNTRRVVWVSESRSKKALDEFFQIIGKAACSRIEVVSIDQHDDYAKSVREHCTKAKIVWDRFHLMKTFGEALNEVRKTLHERLDNSEVDLQKLTRGKYRFSFLKNSSRRTREEREHIDDVVQRNEDFAALEIIKEGMAAFFDSLDLATAKERLIQIGRWIDQKIVADMLKGEQPAFRPLETWYKHLAGGWDTLKNYFEFRVTSALAEGVNNVIKALKRRAFGFRNMDYFRLKIMQVCGYLNSRYIKFAEVLGT